MSFIGKEYTVDRYEKIEEFFKSVGMTDEMIKAYTSFKTTQKIEKDGDTYTLSITTPKGKKETNFKSGVEFDDTTEKGPIKTTNTIDGNTMIQVLKTPNSTITYKTVYNGNEMVATITNDQWSGEAKVYYRAN